MKNLYSRNDVLWIGISLALTLLGVLTAVRTGEIIWATWFFGVCTVILLLSPILQSRRGSMKERVEFDDHMIRRYMATGKIESIRWNEVHEISIVTTDEGPFVDDVFWLFVNHDQSRGCAVSNNAEGFAALLEKMQSLPNFDNEAVVIAMGSASHNRFVVWRRTDPLQSASAEHPA